MGMCFRLGFFVVAMTLGISVHSQSSETVLSNDPQAEELLDRTEEYLLDKVRLSASYTMEMSLPGNEPEILEGTLDQDGEMVRIEAGDYLIISNGETRWVYDKASNEVNIYDGQMQDAPATLIGNVRFFRSEAFVYRLADEYAGAGERSVECKPVDKSSDFTKTRLTVNADSYEPVRIEIFEKGGYKTDMRVLKIEEVSNFDGGHFVFNPDDFPGVRVEDLRID